MKWLSLLIATGLSAPSSYTQAAVQQLSVKTRVPILGHAFQRIENREQFYPFRADIVSDSEGVKAEQIRNDRPLVTAQPGERYSIRLYNPLPVRVAVNVTVDGVNSISGKPSGISDGAKWLLGPYETMTIRGWQVNGAEERRFFFTEKPKSYAKWRGNVLRRDLAKNCGVIGVAYFWSQKELDQYWQEHPIVEPAVPTSTPYQSDNVKGTNEGAFQTAGARASSVEAKTSAQSLRRQEAGTGMGEREVNPTTVVDFRYDTGMYTLAQAVVIYYDFLHESMPNPFPGLGFAPEMP